MANIRWSRGIIGGPLQRNTDLSECNNQQNTIFGASHAKRWALAADGLAPQKKWHLVWYCLKAPFWKSKMNYLDQPTTKNNWLFCPLTLFWPLTTKNDPKRPKRPKRPNSPKLHQIKHVHSFPSCFIHFSEFWLESRPGCWVMALSPGGSPPTPHVYFSSYLSHSKGFKKGIHVCCTPSQTYLWVMKRSFFGSWTLAGK